MLDWQAYQQIADSYKIKARYQDRDDLRQEIILRLATVSSRNEDKPLSQLSMYRVASYVVMNYWHSVNRNLQMSSVNVSIEDDEGHETELYQTLADDKAIDLDNWVDCKTWLRGCPLRLVKIAYKKVNNIPLRDKERQYLSRYREKNLKKTQIALI